MIVGMKKIFVVVPKGGQVDALNELREKGTVHISHERVPNGYEITEIKEDIHLLTRACNVLEQQERTTAQQRCPAWKEVGYQILHIRTELEALSQQIAKRAGFIDEWEQWGEFSLEDIELIKNKGISVVLAEGTKNFEKALPEGVSVFPIARKGDMQRCALVSDMSIRPDVLVLKDPVKIIPFPKEDISQLHQRQKQDQEKAVSLRKELEDAGRYYDSLRSTLMYLEDRLVFKEAETGMGVSDSLMYLSGFCPADAVNGLVECAKQNRWGLLIEDPQPEDTVPTLLRNPRWVTIIKPVFSLINILPGYAEFDISMVFLLFFSVFFGMLIGDAGYGALFAILTFWAQKKVGSRVTDKAPFFLMYVLSACTITWGLLTGTIFGQAWLVTRFAPLVPALGDIVTVQKLCFLIGTIQLSIAHGWRAAVKLPSLVALSELGWISLLWGMFFIAQMLILGSELPPYAVWFLMAGPALIIFFTKPQKNILKAAGAGVGDLLLNGVNTFTDIVSYIRLFAVGLASVAVADAFNEMALGIGFNTFLAGLLSAVILVVGHVFNIILGAMSILVHGLRLNVLEFSGHLGMEWSGVKYSPFKKRNSNED